MPTPRLEGKIADLIPLPPALFEPYGSRSGEQVLKAWPDVRSIHYDDGLIRRIANTPDWSVGGLRPFLVLDRRLQVFAGTVTMHRTDAGQAWEIGFWIAPEHRGRGLATAGVRQVVTIFRSTAHAIVADVSAGNHGSRLVLERSGFQLAATVEHLGILRYRWRVGGNGQ